MQGFEGKKLRGTNFTAFQQNVCQTMAYSAILTVFLSLFQGSNMVYGLRAQSPKYDWDQGSKERAQGSEEWDQGSQGF